MLKSILHVLGRILVNFHLIAFVGLLAASSRIVELSGYPQWQVGLVILGVFATVFLLRCVILSKYVTGNWSPKELNRFYAMDRANLFYEPWEQKRLFEERFS